MIRVGISGWRYDGWRGNFYPDDLPQREMEPVLSDAAFEEERRRIKDALKG